MKTVLLIRVINAIIKYQLILVEKVKNIFKVIIKTMKKKYIYSFCFILEKINIKKFKIVFLSFSKKRSKKKYYVYVGY